MKSEKIYHIFISHSWRYSDKYEGLINLLNAEASFSYIDYSIPKDDPVHTNGSDEDLYNAIKEQISHASVVLILAGVYATYSKWIDKEIKIAKAEFQVPKPIIAVAHWGAEKMSKPVSDAADMIVRWNSDSIIQAIREVGYKNRYR